MFFVKLSYFSKIADNTPNAAMIPKCIIFTPFSRNFNEVSVAIKAQNMQTVWQKFGSFKFFVAGIAYRKYVQNKLTAASISYHFD